MTFSQSASVTSVSGAKGMCTPSAPQPALLNAKSIDPNVSTVVSIAAFTDASSATSQGTNTASPPASSTRRTVSIAASGFRAATATLHPSEPKRTATARPMPDAAPVTNRTLFLKLSNMIEAPFKEWISKRRF